MTALFIRSRAKRQRLSDLTSSAEDSFWTPGMGESVISSSETPAPTVVANPKRIGNPKWTGRSTATVTVEAPATVTLTPSVVVVTVTSLVQIEPTTTLTLAVPSSVASSSATPDPLFNGPSSSAIKIISFSPVESVAPSSSSSVSFSSSAAPAGSAISSVPESIFVLPTASQIAIVSQATASLSLAASIASPAPSSALSFSEDGIFSLSNSTRIAVVATATELASSSASGVSVLATSAPVSASSASEKIFATPSTRVAAVSTADILPSSQLSAVSASLLSAFSASVASIASSSAASESSVSVESSRSAASRAATFNDGPTPQPGTYVGAPESSAKARPTASARSSDGGSGTAGENSSGQLFGSVPRSAASITVTVLVSLAIVLLLLLLAFFVRRYYKRRQAGHRHLGSDGGTPRAGMWREKDMEEKGRLTGEGGDEEDFQPDAIWRRQVNRINSVDSQVASQPRHVSVAPDMSPISEQHTTSDWTSFVGDGDFGSRSRFGSVDTTASAEAMLAAPVVTKGLGVDTGKAPHPLRHSWVPPYGSPSSQYSPEQESPVAGVNGSPFTPRLREADGTSPTRPDTLKRSPSNIQQSLDRLVGSAAEYLGGLFADDSSSLRGKGDSDSYTAFPSSRVAPPTPTIVPPTPSLYSTSPTQVDIPAFPDRATTYTAAAPDDIARPGTSRGASFDRSPSDGEQFLGITHAHVARNVRGRLGFAHGKEKGMNGGDVNSWAQATATAKERGEHDSLLGGSDPAEQDATSIDPFDDSHAEVQEPPHNPPSSPRNRTDTPPPRVGQPLVPFLSPFGPPRVAQPVTDEDKDNYSSDDTTSTVKRPLSMGTIRPAPRKSLPLANSLLARRRLSTLSNNSSDEDHAPPVGERHRTFSESQIVFRPRPVTRNSTDTFGSRETETEESSTESGGSDESDSSRNKRERMRRVERLQAEERARSLMAERRRRSEGELLKRTVS